MGGRGKRVITGVVAGIALLCLFSSALAKEPNVAGQFYPARSDALREMVSSFLKSARVPEDISPEKVIVAFAPHAGYIFSGSVAGHTYKLLSKRKVDVFVIAGPSHFYPFRGIRLLDDETYKIPLGEVRLDRELIRLIEEKVENAEVDNRVFAREHCLEVQLPFIKLTHPNARVVLVLFGQMSEEELQRSAKELVDLIREARARGRDVLLLVSTDMSHYHPYQEAVKIDWGTIDALRKLDFRSFFRGARKGEYQLCGWIPAAFALAYARHWGDVEFRLLRYANSGDTYGDKSRVVGYMSAVIIEKDKEVSMFTREQKAKLLRLARRSIEHYLRTGQRLKDLEIDDPALYKERGAFVTLKKHGMLRGCIGHIIADLPLCEVVAEMAVQSAVGDPRFPALTLDELPEVEIEISVLSPLKKVESIDEIKVGKHGLLLRKGFYSGLLLPQVPVEYGWDKMTFLQHLAMKAGLPPDGWKGAELYSFTAEVFSESEVFGEKD